LRDTDHGAALLEARGVSRAFEIPGRNTAREVLRDVSLTLHQRDAISVVGPSGSGKSTLLNLMGGLDAPTSGSIRFQGEDLAALPERHLAQIRNQEMGYVFQMHHLLPQCTVLENILIPTIPFRSGASREAVSRARELCARVGIAQLTDDFPARLSGGEQQRVAVVRALINHPRLVLADEPTGSLDHDTAESLVELLLELNREQGSALVVVTHSADLAARMDRTYRLQSGHLA